MKVVWHTYNSARTELGRYSTMLSNACQLDRKRRGDTQNYLLRSNLDQQCCSCLLHTVVMARDRRSRQSGANSSSLVCLVLLILLLCHGISGAGPSRETRNTPITESDERFKSEAIARLSRVFGIDRLPVHSHHRTPPQYMVDLYKSVAYSNGITKTASPYDADIVRGFPDRGKPLSV